ncbi:peroxiredoxin-like family protein [Solemya velum gill symbiont]|uniref:thioredoxin-dependent peroxiredoxin n=2 Tax=Solemya velum gill symbiont TaxID=2340 RepID=A0A0B0H454_SOVGS|nr:peroxiredoxin-like family protein [Solemya velum gill symbiont]KHF24988.1 peroxiredoxin [Solemya velum gill symbiont]OOY34643.1 peroxiredoxin [Solemya velum gill symbiont]OOY37437.1 peroxiredoxin [Solemya velum gill symbiont]OOY40384.1 peroxiredoxin [Solemya velum gill symbiont]OOY42620.1 peroxiredoxin [Solemya velum gill symbiont]
MDSLKKEIDAYNAAKAEKVPAEILATMTQCTEDLKNSGIEAGALKKGDRMPDFELPNQHGKSRRLSDYLSESRVVLNIYRGGWCPYCNLEMKALHDVLSEIEAKGARLVGLTPETTGKAAETALRHEIDIDILSDDGNKVAESMGLVFELPQALRPIYEKIGIDIPAYNGDNSFKLPVPATFIIGQDGVIQYSFVNSDYTLRLEPSEIVTQLG